MATPVTDFLVGSQGVLTATPTTGTSPPAVTLPVTAWNAKKTTNFAKTTNTTGYDSTSKKCWETSLPTTSAASGTLTVELSKSSPAYTTLDDGLKVSLSLLADTGVGLSGDAWIDSVEIGAGSMEDVVVLNVEWHSEGAWAWAS